RGFSSASTCRRRSRPSRHAPRRATIRTGPGTGPARRERTCRCRSFRPAARRPAIKFRRIFLPPSPHPPRRGPRSLPRLVIGSELRTSLSGCQVVRPVDRSGWGALREGEGDAMKLQAVSNRKLYLQIADQIRDQIEGGAVEAGRQLPSERELAQNLGVSRPTVREALIALEVAGLVEVRVGVGAFVRRRDDASAALPELG